MTAALPAARPRSRPAPDGRGNRRLDLDVVRGVAIILALGWHFNKASSGNVVMDALQVPGARFGWAGVDLFFVLSGFLLGTLALREQQRTGGFDGRQFTVRRLLKLWPVLYVFLAVQLLLSDEPAASYLWQNALHVQNYAGTSIAHLWSLAVEEHFYLALAVLFPLFARRRGSPRLLAAVLGAVLVAALALRGWGVLDGQSAVALQWRTHFRVDSITAGVLLALLSVHWPERFDRLVRRRWLLLVVTALGVTFLATVSKSSALGATLGYTVAWTTGGAFLLLLFRARWVDRARWISAPVAFLGRYSYGIYIWHLAAATLALELLPGLEQASSTPVAQGVRYAFGIGAGVLATTLVEKPALRLRDRFFPRATARLPAPTGVDPGRRRSSHAVAGLDPRQHGSTRAAADRRAVTHPIG